MGAGVALRFALAEPERVRGLVLIRPAWLDRPNPPNLAVFRMPALVIANRRDPPPPYDLAVELGEGLPAARLAVVASKEDGDARHRSEVGEAIDAFLGALEDR